MKVQFEDTRIPSVAVPARVIDGLLGIASGAQIKVLLFLMRFDKMAHETAEIAKFCNITEQEVEDAIRFWVRERVFTQEEGKLKLVGTVKTLQVRELPRVQPTVILNETDRGFQDMIAEIQRITGKPMGQVLLSTFYNMAENLHFSPEMICQIAAYCAGIDKFSARYVETLACDWFDNGVDTFEKGEARIRELERARSLENRLAPVFGLKTAFSSNQRKLIAKWGGWGYDLPMIRAAYDRGMDCGAKNIFKYMDVVLEDWHRKGYTDPAQIKEEPKAETGTGRKAHQGLSELERRAIEKMQGGKV